MINKKQAGISPRYFYACRITIHVLQLNIEKAGLPLLCYSLVTTTKTKHKGVPCYDYYNTRYEVSSIPDQLC